MNKLRTDSNWAALKRDQKDKLEDWLFEENLGYKEVLERAEKEFAITGSLTSLKQYAQRLAEERRTRAQEDAYAWIAANSGLANGHVAIEEGAFKLMAISAYEMLISGTGRVPMKEMRQLMGLILKRRRQETREGHLALASKQEKRKADMEYGKGIEKVMKIIKENKPKPLPTKEDLEIVNELIRTLNTEKPKNDEKPQNVEKPKTA